jgi:hypothetical protein
MLDSVHASMVLYIQEVREKIKKSRRECKMKKQEWPKIRDCEDIIIEENDMLVSDNGKIIIATYETLEEIGDGSEWRNCGERNGKYSMKKTYRIDECLLVKGELFPRGFYLHVSETSAEIIVPSDVPGDAELLYAEEIPLSQRIFKATYEDGLPVYAEDGELIGEEI